MCSSLSLHDKSFFVSWLVTAWRGGRSSLSKLSHHFSPPPRNFSQLRHRTWDAVGIVFQGSDKYVLNNPFNDRCLLLHMPRKFTIKNYTFCPHSCIYMFCVDLRTNNDYFPIQHWLAGFYNWDGVCLLRGTDWVFIYSRKNCLHFLRPTTCITYRWV